MAELRDPHLHITFYMDPQEDHAATREAGRPIFKDVEMVRIKYVGDTKREHCAPAHTKFTLGDNGAHITYAERFPEHYAAFKSEEKEALIGSPLEAMHSLPRTKIAELKALNIRNVEGLANLNQAGIKRLGMGGLELVEQARSWLEDADKGAALAKATEDNKALMDRIAALEAQVSGEAAPADGPESWSDDELRAFLTEKGATPRSNAARDKMLDAVREFMTPEAA